MRDPFVGARITTSAGWTRVDTEHLTRLTAGHFPDDPLLPGAFQLGLLVEFAERVFGIGAVCGVTRCTFTRRVHPAMAVTIDVALTEGHLTARLLADDVPATEAVLQRRPA